MDSFMLVSLVFLIAKGHLEQRDADCSLGFFFRIIQIILDNTLEKVLIFKKGGMKESIMTEVLNDFKSVFLYIKVKVTLYDDFYLKR